ncbi:hypothetical protein FKM82_030391 [Ascaphus truei]
MLSCNFGTSGYRDPRVQGPLGTGAPGYRGLRVQEPLQYCFPGHSHMKTKLWTFMSTLGQLLGGVRESVRGGSEGERM